MAKKKKLKHIAIIMDGNGRWAKKRGLSRIEGHEAGSKNVRKIVEACINNKIKYLTLYAFSTENWKRPQKEVKALMNLLSQFIKNEAENFHKNKIRLLLSGDISRFPQSLKKQIYKVIDLTKNNIKLIVNVALNYGSRNEILRAVKNIAQSYKNNKIKLTQITQKLFQKHLYYGDILPDPDLLIRTSGELRISNFMLWQLAYSELYFTKTLWPDFNAKNLEKAIEYYYKRSRRFGGL